MGRALRRPFGGSTEEESHPAEDTHCRMHEGSSDALAADEQREVQQEEEREELEQMEVDKESGSDAVANCRRSRH